MKIFNKKIVAFALGLFVIFTTFMTSYSQAAAEETGTKRYVIVLDPGHGGTDPGANRGGYVERDIALSIAYYCKEELEKNNVTVYLTRTDNSSPLMNREQRAEFAYQKNADALVSLHINSTGEDTQTYVSGAEVYYPNANYNSEISGVSYKLSNDILAELQKIGLTNNGALIRNATDSSTYPDGSLADYLGINLYSKLKGFVGILVEHGYINNPNDRLNFMSSQETLKQIGIADARGILNSIKRGTLVYTKGPKGTWVLDRHGWWYRNPDGTYPAAQWALISGQWYYFDRTGYMTTGWQRLGNQWYYMNNSGAMTTGWQNVGGVWYYMDASGAMKTGWVNVGGTWYYLNSSGAMITGWAKLGGTWYYFDSNGAMATGWRNLGGTWYYMNAGGDMAIGWIKYGDRWYYLSSSGAMLTGWRNLGGTWYYFNAGGDMASDTWIGIYYVDSSGAWVATR